MDPQASWDQLLEAYADGDWDHVQDLAEGLIHWLSRDGFPPRATTGSDMGRPWDRAIALAGCRFALSQARKRGAVCSTPRDDGWSHRSNTVVVRTVHEMLRQSPPRPLDAGFFPIGPASSHLRR
jgi:hypothetical protein